MEVKFVADRNNICALVRWEKSPVILTGADGTGKTYLAAQLCTMKPLFKFSRETAPLWLDPRSIFHTPGVKDYYKLYDRHPVIDWPVYQSVFECEDPVQVCSQWLNEPRVLAELRGKTVVWLRRRYITPNKERDLEFVAKGIGKVIEAYHTFFDILFDLRPTVLTNTKFIVEDVPSDVEGRTDESKGN